LAHVLSSWWPTVPLTAPCLQLGVWRLPVRLGGGRARCDGAAGRGGLGRPALCERDGGRVHQRRLLVQRRTRRLGSALSSVDGMRRSCGVALPGLSRTLRTPRWSWSARSHGTPSRYVSHCHHAAAGDEAHLPSCTRSAHCPGYVAGRRRHRYCGMPRRQGTGSHQGQKTLAGTATSNAAQVSSLSIFGTGGRYPERRACRVQPGAAGPARPRARPSGGGAAAERAGPCGALPVAAPPAGLEDAGRAARGAEPDPRGSACGRAAAHRSTQVRARPSRGVSHRARGADTSVCVHGARSLARCSQDVASLFADNRGTAQLDMGEDAGTARSRVAPPSAAAPSAWWAQRRRRGAARQHRSSCRRPHDHQRRPSSSPPLLEGSWPFMRRSSCRATPPPPPLTAACTLVNCEGGTAARWCTSRTAPPRSDQPTSYGAARCSTPKSSRPRKPCWTGAPSPEATTAGRLRSG